MKTETEQLTAAKAAVSHVLNAIADDPRKYYLMGEMTGSYEKLTVAASALWDKPIEQIKSDFKPDKAKYERHCAEVESVENVIRYLRERGIQFEGKTDKELAFAFSQCQNRPIKRKPNPKHWPLPALLKPDFADMTQEERLLRVVMLAYVKHRDPDAPAATDILWTELVDAMYCEKSATPSETTPL